jgi:hypothetical protein
LALPSYTGARLASVDLTQAQPAEYRADLVVVLLQQDLAVRVVIVEVQLAIDPRKRFTWPTYVIAARALHRCPADLLIVAPDPAVAAWAAEPIEIGVPGFVLHPPVLGQVNIPIVTDPMQAAHQPELGVLSALAHGQGEHGRDIAAAVLPAIDALDDERARLYYDLVYNALPEAARRAMEAQMKGYSYQSDFAKKYVAEGHRAGLAEGTTKGRIEGLAEGTTKGRAQGERATLLLVLQTRFGELPAAAVARIEAADGTTLERWVRRSVTAPSLAEVLDEPS